MDESVPREGRPYGGCAILWKSSLTLSATMLDFVVS